MHLEASLAVVVLMRLLVSRLELRATHRSSGAPIRVSTKGRNQSRDGVYGDSCEGATCSGVASKESITGKHFYGTRDAVCLIHLQRQDQANGSWNMVQQTVERPAEIRMIAYILATQPQDIQRFRENIDTIESAWRDMGELFLIAYILFTDLQ